MGGHAVEKNDSMFVCYWGWPRRQGIIDDEGESGHNHWRIVLEEARRGGIQGTGGRVAFDRSMHSSSIMKREDMGRYW